MTHKQTLKQINDLMGSLVRLSLSNEQNFPATYGKLNAAFNITVSNAERMSIALKNLVYREIYSELKKARCFNLKMLDGALVTLRYQLQAGVICEHSLSYFPSPDLERCQNDPQLYWKMKFMPTSLRGILCRFLSASTSAIMRQSSWMSTTHIPI